MVSSKKRDGYKFVPDAFTESYRLPETLASEERKRWFIRNNEILGFFRVTQLALQELRRNFEIRISQGKLQEEDPLKIYQGRGWQVVMPTRIFVQGCRTGTDILARQVFVMLYGSLETFLFELFERSFRQMGINDGILERSLEILMKGKWDAKFCRMRDKFTLDYQAAQLAFRFRKVGMGIGKKTYDNPLSFLDDIALIRHKIVHASSILQGGRTLLINAKMFLPAHVFYYELSDYIDEMFCNRFSYPRNELVPWYT